MTPEERAANARTLYESCNRDHICNRRSFENIVASTIRDAVAAAEAERDEARAQVDAIRKELAASDKLAEDWKREWRMYRDAWVRELGGPYVAKTHEIDSLVLTTRNMREQNTTLREANAETGLRARVKALSEEWDRGSKTWQRAAAELRALLAEGTTK